MVAEELLCNLLVLILTLIIEREHGVMNVSPSSASHCSYGTYMCV